MSRFDNQLLPWALGISAIVFRAAWHFGWRMTMGAEEGGEGMD